MHELRLQRLRVSVLSLLLVCCSIAAGGCSSGDDDDSSKSSTGGAGSGGSGMTSGSGGSGTSSGAGGASASMSAAVCAEFCAKVTPLHCSGDTRPCEVQCPAYYDGSICRDELRALLECASKQAASDFECDAQNQADVKTNLCMSERTAAQTCVGSK